MVEGGPVSNNKGLSLPGVAVSVPALSDKDEEDLRFALRLGVDFIALSFVRSADDVELVRDIMRQEDIDVPVIAKLEKPEAVENLEAIVEAFDGDHGGPRRPRRGAAAGAGAAGAEAGRSRPPASATSRSSWPPRCSSR